MDFNEDIFMGPIQKQQIIKMLKHHNLLDDRNLEPLKELSDTDIIDLDLSAFYWHILFNKNTKTIPKKPEPDQTTVDETFTDLSDFDISNLDGSDILENIEWSQLMQPKHEKMFEEFEKSLILLENSMTTSSWQEASLKLFLDYTKDVLTDSNEKKVIEELKQDLNIEMVKNDVQENKIKTPKDESSILVMNDADECELKCEMKNVFDLDKRINDLMKELVFDDSETKNDTFDHRPSLNENSELNDTLEEMEVLLKCGESYMTRESITQKSSFVRSKSDESIYDIKPNSIKTEKLFKTPPLKKSKPKTKLKTLSATKSTSNILREPNHFESVFKIPTSRPPKKTIQSPIGQYIKNSSTIPLIKKVVSTTITSPNKLLDDNMILMNNMELLQENNHVTPPTKLPTKMYRPAARNLFIEKENEPNIPQSIKKLYSSPAPQIIKHIGRVPSEEISINTSSDLENLNRTNDENKKEVSLYISKQALHTNSLQMN